MPMRSSTTTIETSITVDLPMDGFGATEAGEAGAVEASEGGPKVLAVTAPSSAGLLTGFAGAAAGVTAVF
jgi:hypothetical protein